MIPSLRPMAQQRGEGVGQPVGCGKLGGAWGSRVRPGSAAAKQRCKQRGENDCPTSHARWCEQCAAKDSLCQVHSDIADGANEVALSADIVGTVAAMTECEPGVVGWPSVHLLSSIFPTQSVVCGPLSCGLFPKAVQFDYRRTLLPCVAFVADLSSVVFAKEERPFQRLIFIWHYRC